MVPHRMPAFGGLWPGARSRGCRAADRRVIRSQRGALGAFSSRATAVRTSSPPPAQAGGCRVPAEVGDVPGRGGRVGQRQPRADDPVEPGQEGDPERAAAGRYPRDQEGERGSYPAIALDGYRKAVELLHLLAWFGMGRSSQERWLARVPGLAQDAAAWALFAGDQEKAVEVLEQGRGILWSQLLDLRTDLAASGAVPGELTSKLAAIRAELDQVRDRVAIYRHRARSAQWAPLEGGD
jgi:hypothetical protein